jgi:alginate O-acetyltransferase complex protein AlgI
MIFNSVTYIIFLAIVVVLYWSLARQGRLLLLLAASIIFYGFWSFVFVPLMLLSTLIDYIAARLIGSAKSRKTQTIAMATSLVANLSLLVLFKYYYFISDNVTGLASLFGADLQLPYMEILLPIGISFYTFQTISYTIDVYRGFIKPVREFTLFATYVTFFPQLVAGPILRASEVMWQLDHRPKFNTDTFSEGVRRILGGLFLKVVLADNIAPFVNDAFSQDPRFLGPLDTMTMAFLFGFQIYFDFAAYSHIALGSALLFGIRFPENFHFPYLATSPRIFWRRWHISLSSWIRDYLYLPLTGAKVHDRSTGGIGEAITSQGRWRVAAALFATWAIMGLWHGAAWAFVVWGLWHATLIQLYRQTAGIQALIPEPMRSLVGWSITLPLVMLSWIPFRTQSLETTGDLLANLFRLERLSILGLRETAYLVAAITMVIVLVAPFAGKAYTHLRKRQTATGDLVEVAGLAVVTALVLIYLRPLDQFIYFQF